MILGLIAGGVVRSERAPWAKVRWLAVAGVIGLAAGAALGWLGDLPGRQTHLDAELGALQRRLVFPADGRVLRW